MVCLEKRRSGASALGGRPRGVGARQGVEKFVGKSVEKKRKRFVDKSK